MRVRVGDHIEGDVDATGIRRHGGGVLVDGVLVERVDLTGRGQAPGGTDLLGYRLELRARAAGQENPGAGEAARGPPDSAISQDTRPARRQRQ